MILPQRDMNHKELINKEKETRRSYYKEQPIGENMNDL